MKNLGTYKMISSSNPSMQDIAGEELWLFLTEDKLFGVRSQGPACSFRTTEVSFATVNPVTHQRYVTTRSGSVYVFEKTNGPACPDKATLFRRLYTRFERVYNDAPVQMSRADAFRAARNDHLITMEVFNEAHDLYGDLWNYTGD